jgi:hypothetical protein
LGWSKYSKRELPVIRKEITEYLEYYHNERIHLSPDRKTPNQFLAEQSLLVPATISKVADI